MIARLKLLDWVVRHLPVQLRRQLGSQNDLIRALLRAGSLTAVVDEVKKTGFTGKWTRSEELHPPHEDALVPALMDSLRLMKGEQAQWPAQYDPGWWGSFLNDQWRAPQ